MVVSSRCAPETINSYFQNFSFALLELFSRILAAAQHNFAVFNIIDIVLAAGSFVSDPSLAMSRKAANSLAASTPLLLSLHLCSPENPNHLFTPATVSKSGQGPVPALYPCHPRSRRAFLVHRSTTQYVFVSSTRRSYSCLSHSSTCSGSQLLSNYDRHWFQSWIQRSNKLVLLHQLHASAINSLSSHSLLPGVLSTYHGRD